MDIHTDIAVIGGGLAGLTAAATAARGGASHPGPRGPPAGRTCPDHRARRVPLEPRRACPLPRRPRCGRPRLRRRDPVRCRRRRSARYLGARGGDLHRLPTGPGSLLRTSLLGARSKARLAGRPGPAPPHGAGDARGDLHPGVARRLRPAPGRRRRGARPCCGSGPTAPTSTSSAPTRRSPSCSWPRPAASSTSTADGPSSPPHCPTASRSGRPRRPRTHHARRRAVRGRRGRGPRRRPSGRRGRRARPPPPGRSFPIHPTGATWARP